MTTTTAVPAGYTIDEVESTGISDELVRQFVELTWALEREQTPEDPDRPFEAIAARIRVTSPMFTRKQWGAFQGGRLVGFGVMVRNHTGTNENLRDVSVNAHPDHRRRGLGRALFARAVEAIGEGEEILLNGWTSSRVPAGIAFAERTGAKAALRMRMSQLELTALDRDLMREWAAIDPRGYRLEWIDAETPDRLMANVITAWDTMNTMPREGLQMEDWKTTPEIVREQERMRRERGQEHLLLLAIDESTGATASFTDLSWDPRAPHVIGQGGTATVPEHRGKGLGKWVKARMALRVLDEMPGARWIRTSNAGSNAAMLAINTKMGFTLAWDNAVWQMPLADAQRYVRR